MARSGLQQDVINLYRQGFKNALSKPAPVREAFMLHWRYTFRHPQLKKRDYAAIEHQLRRLSKTLEMLQEPSVNRITVSDEMRHWWSSTVASTLSRTSTSSSNSASPTTSSASNSTSSALSASSRGLFTASVNPSSSSSTSAAFARAFSSTSINSMPNKLGADGREGNEAPDTSDVGETALEKGEPQGGAGAAGPESGNADLKAGDKKKGKEREERGQQWGGKLPGHGGT